MTLEASNEVRVSKSVSLLVTRTSKLYSFAPREALLQGRIHKKSPARRPGFFCCVTESDLEQATQQIFEQVRQGVAGFQRDALAGFLIRQTSQTQSQRQVALVIKGTQ